MSSSRANRRHAGARARRSRSGARGGGAVHERLRSRFGFGRSSAACPGTWVTLTTARTSRAAVAGRDVRSSPRGCTSPEFEHAPHRGRARRSGHRVRLGIRRVTGADAARSWRARATCARIATSRHRCIAGVVSNSHRADEQVSIPRSPCSLQSVAPRRGLRTRSSPPFLDARGSPKAANERRVPVGLRACHATWRDRRTRRPAVAQTDRARRPRRARAANAACPTVRVRTDILAAAPCSCSRAST